MYIKPVELDLSEITAEQAKSLLDDLRGFSNTNVFKFWCDLMDGVAWTGYNKFLSPASKESPEYIRGVIAGLELLRLNFEDTIDDLAAFVAEEKRRLDELEGIEDVT